MGNSLFSIGLSGLYAAQAGIATTSHNISNVDTPGYNRQTVIQGTATPQFTGGGYIGQGTTVETVRRIYDDFLAVHARQTASGATQAATYASHAANLDALLGDAQAGLTPALADFFAGLDGVAKNPADISSRQVLMSDAQGLSGRLNDLYGQLEDLRANANTEVKGAVDSINTAAKSLAALNQQIALASAAGGATRPPNDLLDQRDQLLADINQQVGASAVVQSDGTLSVFLSNGTPLVVGATASTLSATPSSTDPRDLAVGLKTGGATVTLRPGDLTGGTLGGALAFRDGALAQAEDRMGAIALSLAQSVNAQHALGQDLNGNPGGVFFTAPSPRVQPASANTGTAALGVAVPDATALTGSNYTLAYDGTQYTLTRLSDNTTQSFATLPQTVDGLVITLSGGTPAAGDSFAIEPFRDAARDIRFALNDPRQVAAAAPIRTGAALANTGTGSISAGSVDAAYLAAPLASTFTLTYGAGTNAFTGFPATQAVTVTSGGTSTTYAAGAAVPYTAGATYTFGGVSVVLSGAPAGGDSFSIGPNTGGTGDGRNAQALAALFTQGGQVTGNLSLADANAQLTSYVGTTAHQAQVESDAAAALATQAQTAQQSLSGVNLDEEAANLQKYQQAYQAAGKVLAIADSLFQSILAIANA